MGSRSRLLCHLREFAGGRKGGGHGSHGGILPPRAAATRLRACRPAMRSWSVLALDDEVGATDRSGQLGLLPSELEAVDELGQNVHPIGQLESDSAQSGERVSDGGGLLANGLDA